MFIWNKYRRIGSCKVGLQKQYSWQKSDLLKVTPENPLNHPKRPVNVIQYIQL